LNLSSYYSLRRSHTSALLYTREQQQK